MPTVLINVVIGECLKKAGSVIFSQCAGLVAAPISGVGLPGSVPAKGPQIGLRPRIANPSMHARLFGERRKKNDSLLRLKGRKPIQQQTTTRWTNPNIIWDFRRDRPEKRVTTGSILVPPHATSGLQVTGRADTGCCATRRTCHVSVHWAIFRYSSH